MAWPSRPPPPKRTSRPCINQVERELQGGEAPDSVRMACYVGLSGGHDECASGLTAGGVTDGTAVSACRVAPK
ncbi:hypothetical protein ACFO9E_19315 [Streptomyces maoxianensis]|uniref:Uncharacterized protein n=1 Tax=Streptomyces maoxianensis TaxID=1459942 RepID=A0ABV9G7A3_9ACTN